jgi:glutathione S-transferase
MLAGAMSTGPVKLYVLPGSHPCDAVMAALELKGIPYKRVDWLPLSQLVLGPLRYGAITVPGMRAGEERLAGSRTIMRALDRIAPAPALLPAPGDPAYARVLEIERWGDEVFQSVPRRLIDAAFMREPRAMESYAAGYQLPLPLALMRPTMPLVARLMGMRNSARDDSARADLAALPRQLERIDAWISEGLLGGEQPNAADLQVGSSIRLLHSIADLRELLDEHAAVALAGYFPPLLGEIPAGTLPATWLVQPERSATA